MTYRDQPVLPAFSDTSSADFSGLAHAPALTKSHSPSRFSHALFSNLILSLRAGFFWLIYLYLRGDGKADGVQFPAIKLGTVRISSTLSALIGFFLFVQFSTRTLSFLWNSWIRYSPAHLGRLMIYLEPSWENAVHRFHKFTHLPRTLAILGNSHDTSAIARSLSPVSDIVSVFELDIDDEETALCAVRELGRNGEVNTLVLAEDHNGLFDIAALINHLREMPLQVLVYSEVNPDETARKPRRSLGGLPLAIVSDAPIHFFCRVLKSSFDRICALVLILLMFPLLLMIAASVAIESRGPVIFRQRRNGWAGGNFTVFKFRTMRTGSDSTYQTFHNDQRITRIGFFLRRSSLDELPQLLNVLLGNMSLVGPRPHADSLHQRECVGEAIIANYARRYRMKPGMTGWAQVNGLRGPIHTPAELRRRIELDLFYIEHWSFWFDLKILLLTPLCVVRAKNAL